MSLFQQLHYIIRSKTGLVQRWPVQLRILQSPSHVTGEWPDTINISESRLLGDRKMTIIPYCSRRREGVCWSVVRRGCGGINIRRWSEQQLVVMCSENHLGHGRLIHLAVRHRQSICERHCKLADVERCFVITMLHAVVTLSATSVFDILLIMPSLPCTVFA